MNSAGKWKQSCLDDVWICVGVFVFVVYVFFLSKKKHWNQENQNNYYSKARIATWIYGDA